MLRSEVPTPALLVDIEALDRNIAVMREAAQAMGVSLRPHAKTHKCVEIAQRLAAAGSIGISCATIGEAEAMALGGLRGILITAPLTTAQALDRLRCLLLRGADVAIVADHPENVPPLASIAAATGRTLPVLIDVDVGLGRTGCLDAGAAVTIAKRIASASSLRFSGVQAYWGHLQQVMPFSERTRRVGEQVERLRVVIAALGDAGLPPPIVSGGGTGSHRIDGASGIFTELQPGSFLFLDSCYGAVPLSETGNPFTPSLFVAAAVVSANKPGRLIVNGGYKAFATDSGKPVAMRGGPTGAVYSFMGDEHGALDFHGSSPPLGAIIEFLTSHCDPTVNLYSQIYVVRGDEVVDIWQIRSRY